jgi:hypothetical protein
MSRRGGQRTQRRRPRSHPAATAGSSAGVTRRNRRLAFVLLAAFALIALAVLATPFVTAPGHP